MEKVDIGVGFTYRGNHPLILKYSVRMNFPTLDYFCSNFYHCLLTVPVLQFNSVAGIKWLTRKIMNSNLYGALV